MPRPQQRMSPSMPANPLLLRRQRARAAGRAKRAAARAAARARKERTCRLVSARGSWDPRSHATGARIVGFGQLRQVTLDLLGRRPRVSPAAPSPIARPMVSPLARQGRQDMKRFNPSSLHGSFKRLGSGWFRPPLRFSPENPVHATTYCMKLIMVPLPLPK